MLRLSHLDHVLTRFPSAEVMLLGTASVEAAVPGNPSENVRVWRGTTDYVAERGNVVW